MKEGFSQSPKHYAYFWEGDAAKCAEYIPGAEARLANILASSSTASAAVYGDGAFEVIVKSRPNIIRIKAGGIFIVWPDRFGESIGDYYLRYLKNKKVLKNGLVAVTGLPSYYAGRSNPIYSFNYQRYYWANPSRCVSWWDDVFFIKGRAQKIAINLSNQFIVCATYSGTLFVAVIMTIIPPTGLVGTRQRSELKAYRTSKSAPTYAIAPPVSTVLLEDNAPFTSQYAFAPDGTTLFSFRYTSGTGVLSIKATDNYTVVDPPIVAYMPTIDETFNGWYITPTQTAIGIIEGNKERLLLFEGGAFIEQPSLPKADFGGYTNSAGIAYAFADIAKNLFVYADPTPAGNTTGAITDGFLIRYKGVEYDVGALVLTTEPLAVPNDPSDPPILGGYEVSSNNNPIFNAAYDGRRLVFCAYNYTVIIDTAVTAELSYAKWNYRVDYNGYKFSVADYSLFGLTVTE